MTTTNLDRENQLLEELTHQNFNPQTHGSVAILVKKGSQILIIQRSKDDDFGPELWDVPGGSCDNDHIDDIRGSAMRELEEEVGIKNTNKNLHYLDTYNYFCTYEKIDKKSFIYTLEVPQTQEITLSFEHQDYKWIQIEELNNYEFLKTELIDYIKNHAY